ncbi:MAG: PAS domain S-box protein [Candidatus Nealsonbacteria bacterium]|nr:PAS domain S-box protein [Candidatus Nealsonbacteria bacterium]
MTKKQQLLLKYSLLFIVFGLFLVTCFSFLHSFILVFGMALVVISTFLFGFFGGFLSIAIVGATVFFTTNKIASIILIEIFFGSLIYILAVFLTQRMRMIIRGLKESEEKYRNLVERANDGIVINQDGIIKYANPRIQRIIGYKAIEVIGTKLSDYMADKSALPIIDRYKIRMTGKSVPSIYETLLKHKIGGRINVELNAGTIEYEGKGADLIIIRDITQRKQVEDIFHQREQEFRILVERSPDIISRFDRELRYIYINPAVEKELGFPARSFFWKGIGEVGLSEENVGIWKESLESVFSSGKEKTIYMEQSALYGRKYYNIRLIPELNKKGEVRTVLAVSRDITPAKEIDKIKSEFISVSSHQLRTPLSVIRWCSIMLLEGGVGEMNEEQNKYVSRIYESSKKIIKMINAFFNVTTLDLGILSISPQRMDFLKSVESILEEASEEMKDKGVTIDKKYPANMPEIKADKKLISVILRGLMSNAIKYNDPGGKIWIEVGIKDQALHFKIADNGYGIPGEDQNKIFSKFFRASNIKNKEIYGAGLDLYIIKSIINNCDGEIWFESPNPQIEDEKKGSVFYFTIPLAEMKEVEGKNELIV